MRIKLGKHFLVMCNVHALKSYILKVYRTDKLLEKIELRGFQVGSYRRSFCFRTFHIPIQQESVNLDVKWNDVKRSKQEYLT